MKDIKARIIAKKSLTHDVLEFVLQPEEPIQYKAGQYVMIKVPQGFKFQYRAYSIANHPEDRDNGIVRIVIKILPQGLASEYLKNKKVGDEIELRGGLGFFVFKSEAIKNIYLVATGTGLVPMLCFLEEVLAGGSDQQFILLWGNRYKVDIYFEELLKELSEKHPNFTYQLVLSKPVGYWTGAKGYVTDILKVRPIDSGYHVYLCGLPQMVEDCKIYLQEQGLTKDQIFEEKYVSLGLTQHQK